MAEDKVINELTKIKGLSKKNAVKLYRAGIRSIKNLGNSNPDELSKITGIAKKQLTTWIILARAQERKKFIEVDAAAEELSQLLEIKIDDAKKLVSAGVMSVEDLAEESPDLLSEDTGIDVPTINAWIKKAKEIKKIPPEKRKVIIIPTTEVSFGSKLSGAFIGSSSSFNSIYKDSSSFGQSLVFVLLTGILFCLYLSMSQATIGGFSLTSLWEMTQMSIVFEIGGMQITFYPIVFLGGVIIVILLWLVLGKIISHSRNLEFKNTSAVLGFAMAPGILLIIVVLGKFLPIINGELRSYLLPTLLVIFSAWVALIFFRGLLFSPREATTLPSTPLPKSTPAPSSVKSETSTPILEVLDEQPAVATPAESKAHTTPTAPTAPTPPQRTGPLHLSEFVGIIDQASQAALQKAGFNTSIDLLRASSKDIATRTGLPQSKIIIWRIISDLLRIPGMTLEYAVILTKSGVRSVKHLSKINENALRVQVLDTISKENIATTITAQMLSEWIKAAQNI